MKKHNFKELRIWKESIELCTSVYSLTKNLPPEEKFNLISQLNRCSVSIPSNIAEGAGRTTNKQFAQFLDISLGSAFELETQLILVERIFEIDCTEIIENTQKSQKMIQAFKRQLDN